MKSRTVQAMQGGGRSATVPDDLVSVGHITGAYGVDGWIRVHPYSNDASALLNTKTWWLGFPEGNSETLREVHDMEALHAKWHGDVVVARMMGIVDRCAAESLKGNVIQIQRSHFPVLEQNEFYWLDLIGSAVDNLQGESLGTVVGLLDNGAHPILRVVSPIRTGTTLAGATNQEYLIPFIERFVPIVDQKNKKITVDWGLDF